MKECFPCAIWHSLKWINMCRFLTCQAKINQMFHLNKMCQYHTLKGDWPGFLPLVMWHAADIVSASVWSLLCLVQLDLRDSRWSEALRFMFVSPVSLRSNLEASYWLTYTWFVKMWCPWEQPASAWLDNIKILSLSPFKARPLHSRTGLMRLHWAAPTVCF